MTAVSEQITVIDFRDILFKSGEKSHTSKKIGHLQHDFNIFVK